MNWNSMACVLGLFTLGGATAACSSSSSGVGAASDSGTDTSSPSDGGPTEDSGMVSDSGMASDSSDGGVHTDPDSGTDAGGDGGLKVVFTTVDAPGGGPTTINGINDHGDVVGFTVVASDAGNVNTNFVRAAAGTFATLTLGDPAAMANAINGASDVVGAANGQAFLLHSGGAPMSLVPVTGAASSVALGINAAGLIVGQYAADATHTPGFFYQGTTFTTGITPTTASNVTNIQGVNGAGLAVGFYSEDGGMTQHGFTYDTTTKTATPVADPSTSRTAGGKFVLNQILGINDGKKAVGYYQTTDGSQYGYLLDVASATYTYLDAPNAAPPNADAGTPQITQITGINNSGEICGFFVDAAGSQHGFTATTM